MRFSIITCTYNRAQDLARCLDSSCAQDYDKSDFEILVIDNNSKDNTSEVFKEYKGQHSKLNLRYALETKQGLSHALNRGIELAQGEFIVYLDDDETIDSGYLSTLNKSLLEYPNIELAASSVTPVYESEKPKWLSHYTMRLITGYFNKGERVIQLGTKDYPGTGHTIIKRELYTKFGKFNTDLGRKGESLMGAEDKDMSFRLISNKIVCYYLPKITIYHHIPDSKLTVEFFNKLTYSIGKSERIRTKAIKGAYFKRLFSEIVKWNASIVLLILYSIILEPQKGTKLIQFRWNVTKGLLGY